MGQFNQQPDFATIATPLGNLRISLFLDGAALYVGTGGDVHVIMKNIEATPSNIVVFKNVPSGSFLPVIVDAVDAATTATDLIAVK